VGVTRAVQAVTAALAREGYDEKWDLCSRSTPGSREVVLITTPGPLWQLVVRQQCGQRKISRPAQRPDSPTQGWSSMAWKEVCRIHLPLRSHSAELRLYFGGCRGPQSVLLQAHGTSQRYRLPALHPSSPRVSARGHWRAGGGTSVSPMAKGRDTRCLGLSVPLPSA
jgi:hypothetical protein